MYVRPFWIPLFAVFDCPMNRFSSKRTQMETMEVKTNNSFCGREREREELFFTRKESADHFSRRNVMEHSNWVSFQSRLRSQRIFTQAFQSSYWRFNILPLSLLVLPIERYAEKHWVMMCQCRIWSLCKENVHQESIRWSLWVFFENICWISFATHRWTPTVGPMTQFSTVSVLIICSDQFFGGELTLTPPANSDKPVIGTQHTCEEFFLRRVRKGIAKQ